MEQPSIGEARSAPPPAAPVAAIPAEKKGLGSYKVWIIIGAVALVVVVVVMLFLRNRSRRLREELERQKRQELHEQSSAEAARLAEAYYANYPVGLYYDQAGQPHAAPEDSGQAPPSTPTPASMPSCTGDSCPAPQPSAPASKAKTPAAPPKQSPQPPNLATVFVSGGRPNLIPSPSGVVRELPDEQDEGPPTQAIPAEPLSPSSQQLANNPTMPAVQASSPQETQHSPTHHSPQQRVVPPVPPLLDDPYLTPIDMDVEPAAQPAKDQPKEVSPPALQDSFKLPPSSVSDDPFAPIAEAVPMPLTKRVPLPGPEPKLEASQEPPPIVSQAIETN